MTPVLALDNIRFSRNRRPILQNISWSVLPGQIAAILGPNGSGKSTLLRLASGYLWPHSGTVQLLGQTLGTAPLAPLRARLGIVEATTLYPFDESMTARDIVASGYFSSLTLGFHKISRPRAAHAAHLLDQVGLRGRAAQLYATLSTGERLRCLLARALVRQPALLLLDEPTAGLDLPARESLLATLSRLHQQNGTRSVSEGRAGSSHSLNSSHPTSQSPITNYQLPRPPALITITHHLEELLPGTTNILLLSAAGCTIASGKPQDVLTNAHLTAAYGVPIHVLRRHGRYSAHVDPATWNELL